jgi:hypothetical protein
MTGTIVKKDTPSRMKSKFSCVVWTQIGPTSTTKNVEHGIIRIMAMKALSGGIKVKNFTWQDIYEIGGSEKSFIPEF